MITVYQHGKSVLLLLMRYGNCDIITYIICILPGHAWQCASVQWQRSGSSHLSCRKASLQRLLSRWPSILWTGHDAGHWRPGRLSLQKRPRWRGRFEDFLSRVYCGPRTLSPPGMNRETVMRLKGDNSVPFITPVSTENFKLLCLYRSKHRLFLFRYNYYFACHKAAGNEIYINKYSLKYRNYPALLPMPDCFTERLMLI